MVLNIVVLIVYAFSWQMSAILSFFATLASKTAALLLVDGIDKGSEKKKARLRSIAAHTARSDDHHGQ